MPWLTTIAETTISKIAPTRTGSMPGHNSVCPIPHAPEAASEPVLALPGASSAINSGGVDLNGTSLARSLLILTILTMVFISLQPFVVKRVFLLIAAIVCLLTASCFADSVFLTVGSTPCHLHMGRISPILQSSKSNRSEHEISFALVNHCIEDMRGVPCGFSQEWQTSEEMAAGPANPTINWTTYETEQLGKHAYSPLYTYFGAVTSFAP